MEEMPSSGYPMPAAVSYNSTVGEKAPATRPSACIAAGLSRSPLTLQRNTVQTEGPPDIEVSLMPIWSNLLCGQAVKRLPSPRRTVSKIVSRFSKTGDTQCWTQRAAPQQEGHRRHHR